MVVAKKNTDTDIGIQNFSLESLSKLSTEELIKIIQDQREELDFDTLTGALSYRALRSKIDYFKKIISNKKRRRDLRSLGLIYIDVDGFKEINDSNTYSFADDVLKEIVNRIKSTIRESDSLYRKGGDEFIVLVPGIDTKKSSVELIELGDKLRAAVASEPISGFFPTVSVGVAVARSEKETESLADRANEALKKAKQSGGNIVKTYSPDS